MTQNGRWEERDEVVVADGLKKMGDSEEMGVRIRILESLSN